MFCFNSIRRFVPVTVFALAASATAYAADPVDFGKMELDVDYKTNMYASAQGYYEPESNGVLCVNIIGGSLAFYPFADEGHSEQIDMKSHGYVNNGYNYYIDVTAGHTVYFYDSFMADNATIKLTMDKPLETTGIYPDPAKEPIFSLSGTGNVQISFNQPVKAGDCYIKAGSTINKIRVNATDNYLTIDLYTELQSLISSGALNYGDEFSVLMTGLASTNDPDNKYNGNGEMALTYTLAAKPVEVKSVKEISGPFLSYFVPGSDDSKLVIDFTGEIDPTRVRAQLSYGDLDAALDGNFYLEELTPVVSENNTRVTVDFAGKVRRPADMVANAQNYGSVNVVVNNLFMPDGQYVYSIETGSLGTKTFNWNYQEVESDIVAEFTPRSGSSIENANTIEIYVKNYDQLTHNGVRFEWPDGKADVAKSDLKLESDQDGTAVIVTIPDEVKTKRNITVSFIDMYTPDGLDHSAALSARYNVAFSLRGNQCTPRKGDKLNVLTEGSQVVMNIDKPEGLGYVLLTVTDKSAAADAPAMLDRLELKGEDKNFSGTLPQNLFFYIGHTYKFTVTAYASQEAYLNGEEPVGMDYIEYEGERPAYIEATETLQSIDPEDGTEITDSSFNTFTVTFDTMANVTNSSYVLDAYGQRHKLTIKPVGENMDTNPDTNLTICNVYELSLKHDEVLMLGRDITLVLNCIGANGAVIPGNTGEGENSHFEFHYKLMFNDAVSAVATEETDAPAVYYDMRGIRVDNPTSGLYIRRTGDKVEKVLVK